MLKIGDRVRLPDSLPARKGAKPKPRYGVIQPAPFDLRGYALVEKCDCEGVWWVPTKIMILASIGEKF